VAGVIDYVAQLSDEIHYLHTELNRQWRRNGFLHELNAALREQLQDKRDNNAVLRGTIGRLEDTIGRLLDHTECACGEDEEGNYGQCVPCRVRDGGIYP
jgi:hypothetical protein